MSMLTDLIDEKDLLVEQEIVTGLKVKIAEHKRTLRELGCSYDTAFFAARMFIESHAADPDLTPEMIRNYSEYMQCVRDMGVAENRAYMEYVTARVAKEQVTS